MKFIEKSINQSVLTIIKNVDTTERIVEGYYSAFGNIDSDNDVIMPGAYNKTIKEQGPTAKDRIKHLWNHNSQLIPPAKILELKEDQYGEYFKIKISNSTLGNDLLIAYQDKVITEHSVRIAVIKSNVIGTVRYISEVMQLEGSSVIWGANPDTPVVAMKSLTLSELSEQILNVESLLKNGKFSDEVFPILEKQKIMLTSLIEEKQAEQRKEVENILLLPNFLTYLKL